MSVLIGALVCSKNVRLVLQWIKCHVCYRKKEQSLLRVLSCCVGWVRCAVRTLVSLRFPFSINPVWWATWAADHSFYLLSESLVHQCIYKRIDSRIEHDHRRGSSICHIAKGVAWSKKAQEEGSRVSKPGHPKDDTDKNDHQGYSFPHLHHSLQDVAWELEKPDAKAMQDNNKIPVGFYREKMLPLQ